MDNVNPDTVEAEMAKRRFEEADRKVRMLKERAETGDRGSWSVLIEANAERSRLHRLYGKALAKLVMPTWDGRL